MEGRWQVEFFFRQLDEYVKSSFKRFYPKLVMWKKLAASISIENLSHFDSRNYSGPWKKMKEACLELSQVFFCLWLAASLLI